MTIEEAIKKLDENIPEPNNKMVDLEHLPIAIAWKTVKEEYNGLRIDKGYMEFLKKQLAELPVKNAILIKNADEAFQQGLNESRELYKDEVKDQVRKETAREIKNWCDEVGEIYTNHTVGENEIVFDIKALKAMFMDKYGVKGIIIDGVEVEE